MKLLLMFRSICWTGPYPLVKIMRHLDNGKHRDAALGYSVDWWSFAGSLAGHTNFLWESWAICWFHTVVLSDLPAAVGRTASLTTVLVPGGRLCNKARKWLWTFCSRLVPGKGTDERLLCVRDHGLKVTWPSLNPLALTKLQSISFSGGHFLNLRMT